MFPYHDENQTLRTPVVTMILIAVNVVVWVAVQGAGTEVPLATAVCNYGLIPAELMRSRPPGAGFPMGDRLVCVTDAGPEVLNILTSMFLHGSWMHLLGNMWFLWLFGNNIEDSMTRGRFVAFYLLCGVAAALLQVAADPRSIVPMVGASGAISGVMGAYLVLFPHVRVFTLVTLGFFLTRMAVPAWGMLIYWAFIQLASGLMTVPGSESGGVAFWAHIGGFVAGVFFIRLFRRADRLAAHRRSTWSPGRPAW